MTLRPAPCALWAFQNQHDWRNLAQPVWIAGSDGPRGRTSLVVD